jgi:hypothetical protein
MFVAAAGESINSSADERNPDDISTNYNVQELLLFG